MWYKDILCWFGIHLGRKWKYVRSCNLVEYEGALPSGQRHYYDTKCPHCGHTKHKKVDC